MSRVSIYVPFLGGVEAAPVLPYMDSASATLVGQAGQVEDVGAFFGKPVKAYDSSELCQLANMAVRECPTDFACLIFPENVVYDLVMAKPSSYDECSYEQLIETISEVADLVEAFGVEAGGLALRDHTRLWGLTPFSTVGAPSPYVVVCRKDLFTGFRNMEFPFMVYDYFLRSLWSNQAVIRYNGVATAYPNMDETTPVKDFLALYESNDVQHKFANGKARKAFFEFATSFEGV